ncbi:MAG: hypothetical protein KME09_07430 [Pleurocapsa minor HA4230-MV1]|jgi:hypothetical protein|nr:hypothetical protein [Pleurocapsa minor HA4230-MV1]
MNANTKRGLMMTFSPTAIALIVVLISGYVIGVSLGTIAYFANEKNY